MKNLLLILAIIPLVTFSQLDNKDKKSKNNFYKWDIGINGGVNVNNPISDSANLNNLNAIGTLYGLTLVYHFNRFFAFKADFDIENRGWVMEKFTINQGTNQSGSSITELKNVTQVLDYFDIPAFMHIGFGKKLKFDLNIGPYFGFKIKDQIYSYDPDDNQLGDSFTRGAIGIGKFDNFDFGVVYGVGFDYLIHERFSIGFDALYEKGMKIINDGDYKNSSIDFDFGINFHLAKKKKKK